MHMATSFEHANRRAPRVMALALSLLLVSTSSSIHAVEVTGPPARHEPPNELDTQLQIALRKAGFTGKVESTLETRLGRPIDKRLADLGRKLFFDPLGGLHDDNTCAGCHAPSAGFADTQSIAIGVQSNRVVGPGREGPRNQRRTPTVVNTAFYRHSCGMAASLHCRATRLITLRVSSFQRLKEPACSRPTIRWCGTC